MIRTEAEYRQAVRRLRDERQRLEPHAAQLRAMGLTDPQVDHALQPLRAFQDQLAEEIAAYERLRRGEVAEAAQLRGLGHLLVSLRIARGLTQAQLAQRLGVDPSQVSRDERNEYHNVTVERAARILDTLDASIRMEVDLHPPDPTGHDPDREAA